MGDIATLTSASRTTCIISFEWLSITAATSASLLGKYRSSEPMLTPAVWRSCWCLRCRSRRSQECEQSLQEAFQRLGVIAVGTLTFSGLLMVYGPCATSENAY